MIKRVVSVFLVIIWMILIFSFSNKTGENSKSKSDIIVNYISDVLKIKEEIDDCSVQKIRRRADYEIERYMPRKVIFDFDSVTFMDSAGIGLIIGRYKLINMIGGELKIANVNTQIQKIFEMSGLLRLIPVEQKNKKEVQYD